jgi:hypothetical protein
MLIVGCPDAERLTALADVVGAAPHHLVSD